ncbi:MULTISPECIES: hypothetical protein [Protofrankia]|uniref:Uncharacterized protein n=1 Tax=Protofrankia coriariae TaxID=1562887 RepID=A0ABR5F336_9ACTN|nr:MULTISPECIES: hypothetical protein [Protofrankia]KLL11107.1 hypothetical protein FrCorBMG51_13260 [Protofrankia coriariae]ONH34816.1 hypothetical protein BL254_14555 [Protofrankia sp. BMG5.30]
MGTDDGEVNEIKGVLEAARAIRPYLDELVGPAAPDLDRSLANQLTAVTATAITPTDHAAAARQLRALLDGNETTAWFLRTVLEDAPRYRPPYHQPRYLYRQTGGALVLPGDPGPVEAGRYVCPRGDYTWYRPEVGVAIPDCPTHQVRLVRG